MLSAGMDPDWHYVQLSDGVPMLNNLKKVILSTLASICLVGCKAPPIDLTVSLHRLSEEGAPDDTSDTSMVTTGPAVFLEDGLLQVEYVDWDTTDKRLLSFTVTGDWMYATEVIGP